MRIACVQSDCGVLRAYSLLLLTLGKPLSMPQIWLTSTSASVALQIPQAQNSHALEQRPCLTDYMQMLQIHHRLKQRNVRSAADTFKEKDSARPLGKYIPNEGLYRAKTFLIIPSVFINNIKFPASGVSFCFNQHSFLSCPLTDCTTVVY